MKTTTAHAEVEAKAANASPKHRFSLQEARQSFGFWGLWGLPNLGFIVWDSGLGLWAVDAVLEGEQRN